MEAAGACFCNAKAAEDLMVFRRFIKISPLIFSRLAVSAVYRDYPTSHTRTCLSKVMYS